MATRHKILVVDDHEIVRSGLKVQLGLQSDFEVIGEASNGRDAVALAERLAPALLIVDLHMPDMNGIDTIQEIHRRNPNIRILVLTFQNVEEYVLAALQAGANGYMLKNESGKDVILAARAVLEGKTAISPSILGQVMHILSSRGGKETARSHWDILTLREREILQMVAEGHTSKYIAKHLNRSDKTVEKHRANLMKKLNMHSVATLTQFAMTHHLLDVGERIVGL